MTLGNGKPSKKTVEAYKLAIKSVQQKYADKAVALALWNAFRWRIKTLARSYDDIEKLIEEYSAMAEAQLKDQEVKDAVIRRFSEMRNRLAEFNVEKSDDQG